MNEEEESLPGCQQCASIREEVHECAGGCGRLICDFCGEKCNDCKDAEALDRVRLSEKTEGKELSDYENEKAQARQIQPERDFGDKVSRVFDWMFGSAAGALRREVERFEGEFDMYENEDDIKAMIWARYQALPDHIKATYRIKDRIEDEVMNAALKAGTTIGGLAHTFAKGFANPLLDEAREYRRDHGIKGKIFFPKKGGPEEDPWDAKIPKSKEVEAEEKEKEKEWEEKKKWWPWRSEQEKKDYMEWVQYRFHDDPEGDYDYNEYPSDKYRPYPDEDEDEEDKT